MSVEASQKHGPFDTRWPSRRRDGSDRVPAAQPPLAPDVAEGLDWYAFSARYFRGRRRHDFEAVFGYAAYRHGREWRNGSPLKAPRLRLVPPEPVETAIEAESETVGAPRRLAAVAALQVWDWEGGYTPGSNES
jgi:hypothetical protein